MSCNLIRWPLTRGPSSGGVSKIYIKNREWKKKGKKLELDVCDFGKTKNSGSSFNSRNRNSDEIHITICRLNGDENPTDLPQAIIANACVSFERKKKM